MIINELNRIIEIKLVYFGPALSGKTTSLKSLFSHFGKQDQLESIESSVGRTLFFDYGTIIFKNEKWKLKAHIWTTTGQDFYIVTRPITLTAIDGIIFVADSQEKVYERNIISWNELCTYFGENLIALPKIIAFNKQDLPEKFSPDIFLKEIGYDKYQNLEVKKTVALIGEGISESFEKIIKLILKEKK